MSEILHVHCDSVKILPSEEASSSGHDLACFEEFEEFESGHLQDMSEEYFNVFLKPLADEQRLQALREEFEEACGANCGACADDVDLVALCENVDEELAPAKKMILAARRYIVARDYNVFDERWEMVWKLQNGGAQ